METLSWNSW